MERPPPAHLRHMERIEKSTSRAAYDRAMDLFRNVMGLFRRGAGKDREEGAAELLKEQAMTVKAQPPAVGREVKREERPDPNKPGWGQTIGAEIGKARGDRASRD